MTSDGSAGAAGVVISSRELVFHVGTTFSSGHAVTVSTHLVLSFAGLTGADHWMHTDAARAAASPLGRATVPGLLTLSLGALLEPRVLLVRSADAVFYGFDRVRFPAPMFIGDELRLEVGIISAAGSAGAVRAVFRNTFWSAGAKPVCVAEQDVRYTHEQP